MTRNAPSPAFRLKPASNPALQMPFAPAQTPVSGCRPAQAFQRRFNCAAIRRSFGRQAVWKIRFAQFNRIAAGRTAGAQHPVRAQFANFSWTRFARALARATRTASGQINRVNRLVAKLWPLQSPEFPNRRRGRRNDCDFPLARHSHTSPKQNIVVGCWPVPKLNPGSRTTTLFFSRFAFAPTRFDSRVSPISIGLKCRFQ